MFGPLIALAQADSHHAFIGAPAPGLARQCPRSRSSRYCAAPATTSRRSNMRVSAGCGRSSTISTSALPTRIKKATCRTHSQRSSRFEARLGHAREGREFVDHALDVVDLPHDRVCALIEDIAIRAMISLPYLRFSRSAESWIGVSGFLISWAMRRATSAQAELRCAVTRSVMSSSVTTKFGRPSTALAEVTRTL